MVGASARDPCGIDLSMKPSAVPDTTPGQRKKDRMNETAVTECHQSPLAPPGRICHPSLASVLARRHTLAW